MARYLSTSEIARSLGLADSTIRHYRATGRITPHAVTPGGHARYDLDEIARVLGVDTIETPRGLGGEQFARLGEHDVRSSGRRGPLAPEIAALRVHEIAESAGCRWGGRLISPSVRTTA
jgi:hypothetical protein